MLKQICKALNQRVNIDKYDNGYDLHNNIQILKSNEDEDCIFFISFFLEILRGQEFVNKKTTIILSLCLRIRMSLLMLFHYHFWDTISNYHRYIVF